MITKQPVSVIYLLNEQITQNATEPQKTAQMLIPNAILEQDSALLGVLVQNGATIENTLFENLVDPKSLEIFPNRKTNRQGPFNLSKSILKKLNVPMEADWRSEAWDLDTPYAYEHFNGLNLDDAQDKIENLHSSVGEDFLYMPTTCFQFYIFAYMEFLISPRGHNHADAASSFFTYVKNRISSITHSDALLKERFQLTLSLLASSQEWFGAREEIYGSFAEQAQVCSARLQAF